VNKLLEIIVKEYIESNSTPSVIVGMTLLNHWGDSKRGLPLLFPFASSIIPTLIQKSSITEQANVAKGATKSSDYAELEKDTLNELKGGEMLRAGVATFGSNQNTDPIHFFKFIYFHNLLSIAL
jgi:hypothetical protein